MEQVRADDRGGRDASLEQGCDVAGGSPLRRPPDGIIPHVPRGGFTAFAMGPLGLGVGALGCFPPTGLPLLPGGTTRRVGSPETRKNRSRPRDELTLPRRTSQFYWRDAVNPSCQRIAIRDHVQASVP